MSPRWTCDASSSSVGSDGETESVELDEGTFVVFIFGFE